MKNMSLILQLIRLKQINKTAEIYSLLFYKGGKMLDYTFNFNKTPVVVLNIPGKIIIDNKLNNDIKFEIDYNVYSEDIIKKIKVNREQQFAIATQCVTYTEEGEKRELLVPYFIDGERYWYKALSENNLINFSMVTNKVEILRNDSIVNTVNLGHSKTLSFSLKDGDYIFRVTTYTLDDEEISTNDISVTIRTNYYSLGASNVEDIKINFPEGQGNFDLNLEANSKKLYSFKITDIVSENDSIFEFSYFNANSNDPMIKGKIGSEFNLLNDKQIEEIIEHPEMEALIKPEFVFNINEILTTSYSKDDIGVIRFPAIRSKIKDNLSKYYNLKCDVSQNYSVEIDKTEDFLITDKFNNYPLFYKFLITESFENFELLDSDGNTTDYLLEKVQDDLCVVYFNPKRQTNYYYSIDDNPPVLVSYKKSHENFSVVYKDKKVEFEEPFYFGYLMLKGSGTNEVEILFADYNRKKFTLEAVEKDFLYLEDERLKIDKKILGIEVSGDVEIINMLCPMKNNRNNYSFFKKDFKDFVYIAQEVPDIKLKDIPESEISKFNIHSKFILLNGEIEEVQNGPLYLEEIKRQDITFTDIEEWLKEYSISTTEVIKTKIKDSYFLENITDSTRVVEYEDKIDN